MPAKTFQFVISTTPNGKPKDKESKRLVRENAMRDYRRTERLARMKKYEATRADDSAEQHGCIGAARRASQPFRVLGPGKAGSLESSCGSLVLTGPGLGLDPFGTTELPMREDAQWLFGHFLQAMTLRPLMYGNKSNLNSMNHVLARHALQERGVITTILFHASLHADTLRDEPASPSTLHYRGEAIRLLNQRLRDSKDATSDGSIAMVAFLASSVNTTSTVQDEKEAHGKALQTMVSLRGGVSNLGWDGALGMILIVGDLISATMTNSHPTFSALDITSNPLLPLLPPSLAHPFTSCPYNLSPTTDSFKNDIHTLIRSTNDLATLQTTLDSKGSLPEKTVIAFTQLIATIEHRVLGSQLQLPLSHKVEGNEGYELYEAARLTLQLLIAYLFRDFRPGGTTLVALQARLQSVLKSLSPSHNPYPKPNTYEDKAMMLWILWIGGMTSTDQAWYASRIDTVMGCELRIDNMVEVRRLLEGFVWSKRLEDAGWRGLWERVLARRVLNAVVGEVL